jgi:photosystem II stability/assembly factor-like uncharacterized protein
VLGGSIVCLVVTFVGVVLVGAQKDAHKNDGPADTPANTLASAVAPAKTTIAERFGRLPLSFELNGGQSDQAVKFLSRGPGYQLFLTATEAVLSLEKPQAPKLDEFKRPIPPSATASDVREGSVLRLKLIGANASPQVEGQDELPGKVNYLVGNDPENWRRNVPTYRRVHYKNVYPGIDLVYYGNSQRELEYDLVVSAGANPKSIKFNVAGAEGMRLDKTGDLLLTLKHGELSLKQPVIYQLTEAGERREIKGSYVIEGNEIRFKVQGFDGNKPLVIDPVLSYSTYLGAGSNENAFGIAVDSQGSAYVTGVTDRGIFPTTAGAFKTTSQLGGAFVSKLDPTGSTLVYSTYLTSDGQSTGTSIAVDAAGNAHVAGYTSALDFPIVNGLKSASNVCKTTDAAANWSNQNSGVPGLVQAIGVSPSSPNVIYAGSINGIFRSTDAGTTWTKTPLTGAPGFTSPFTLAVDPTNPSVVYVGVINGLFKTTDAGNTITRVTSIPLNFASVSAIIFDPSTPSTMYVGSANGVFKSTDSGSSWTAQNNFGLPGVPSVPALAIDPTTPSTIYAGSSSSGVFKTTNGGANWTAMNTGLGGTNISAIVIDPSNTATVYAGQGGSGGMNKSIDGGASWTPVNNGIPLVFGVPTAVTEMVATASAVYAATTGAGIIKTTNGGANWTSANAGLNSDFVVALAGHPTDPAILYAGTGGSSSRDAFVAKLNPSGSGILFSTLLGGSNDEFANGVAVDANGNIFVVGQTNSTNFPLVNANQSSFGTGCFHAFVSKLNPAAPAYVFSTYLGGNGCDAANGVAVDVAGNAYVTGNTSSSNFPVAGGFQTTLGDVNRDAFVTKFTGAGSLGYSTYLGGNSNDTGLGIATDLSGNAYVTGITFSTNFPTQSPIQATLNGPNGGDAFVTKLNSQGSALFYSTYLGGTESDTGRGIAVDAAGNAFVTGFTSSVSFPVVPGALSTRSQMHKSVDGGGSWTNDNYGLTAPTSGPITKVVVDPAHPSTVYAGTGAGVFKSANGGRTWSAVNNGLNDLQVIALVIDPSTPSTLYVATNHPFITNNDSVYKSTDGGASWNLRQNGIVSPDILSLAIDPVTPATLYLGTLSGPVYKTTDGADNWAPVGNPTSPKPATALTIDPSNHLTIYGGTTINNGGVLKSVDGGQTWQPAGQGVTNLEVVSIAVSPFTPGLLYAGTRGGSFFKSVDGGASWSLVRSAPQTGPGSVVFDPVSSSTIYLVSFGEGLLKTSNGGQTFTPVNRGLNNPAPVALAINPLTPSTLYLVAAPLAGDEAFVTKLNSAGSALTYSTFLGAVSDRGFSNTPNAAAFAIAVDAAGSAYITGLTQSPNLPVTPTSYQPFNRGFSDAFISKLSTSYIISGQVSDIVGQPVSGAEVVLSDGTSLTSITTESDGGYVFSRLREGGSFTVSASAPHFTMAPPSQSFSNLSSDQVANFTANVSDSPFYTISGQVTENGVGLPGVTVTLSGSQSGLRTTDSSGNYSFELIVAGNYTVTPSLLGFNFAPPSQTFNPLSGPQTANFTATRQNFVVTNANNHGTGSLRDAIINANATAGSDMITFNIPGIGVKVISLITSLPDITDTVVIDATSQPGYAGTPLIELDGALTSGNGLVIKAGGSTVRGLAIGRFSSNAAIWLNGCDNNVVQGNYLGVDATGTAARANNRGILMSNSSNNLIGGTTAAARNIISGNNVGIDISGNNNVVQGNFIGTNPTGTAAIPNTNDGVVVVGSQFTNNLIGGTAAGARNLISGNSSRGVTVTSSSSIVQGNLIGTDITGTNKIPNGNGVIARGTNILVGGLTPTARNIVSGNTGDGVTASGTGTKVQGNYIGTDITGTLALGNGNNGVLAGDNAVIGGLVPEARNIISANAGLGNVALGWNNIGSAAIVQGNYIGTDVTGTRSLSSGSVFVTTGVSISSNNHIVGGLAPGARNVISGNGWGINIGDFGSPPIGTVIQGNYIGLNAEGTGALPNTVDGIIISNAVNTTIGGTQPEAANKIAFNGLIGIFVPVGTGNSIRGNSIFSNGSVGIDLGNGRDGVTPNDVNDADTGANNLQNFPVITSVLSTGSSTMIQGTLNSSPNTIFDIDFYSNAALDPTGNGEGAQFFNRTSVTTDINGNATINVTFPAGLPAGRVITATATDPNGNTSEFSAGDPAAATGSVQFTVSLLQVIEDVGIANVTVLRTGGNVGTVTVDYSTADVTALAGQDYTATSGTLTFVGGETSKTIQIPIADDAITEPDETFTLALRNTSSPELLGSPSVLTVTIQDRTTTPSVFVNDAFVVEGNKGTTTQLSFTVNLSAQTGRTVSVQYASSNVSAFGGASCGTPGVDYVAFSGKFTFQPGTSSFTVPVTICGDNNAEGNETFRVGLTNPVNATVPFGQGTGAILNDDVLELVLEEQGPLPNQAAAIDALLGLRDPFRIVGIPEWLATGPDRNTRVLLFARNLELNPGETAAAVTVRLSIGGNTFIIPADDVRHVFEVPDVLSVRDSELTQVKFRLSAILPAGTYTVRIAHGQLSNTGTIRIVP